MAKHTQGEWGVATIDGGDADDEIVTEVNGCMVNIAAVFGAGEYSEARPDGKDEPHYEVSKEEADANARLIAAAPKMLAALERVCDVFPSIRNLSADQVAALYACAELVKEAR